MSDNRNATPEQVKAAMDVLDCREVGQGLARYCEVHEFGWLQDVDACPRAERVADAVVRAAR